MDGNNSSGPRSVEKTGNWTEKYGQRHRQQRILKFPRGVAGPNKVRVYRRQKHHILQWWDPREKRTLSDRVDGDLVSAIIRARQIDERLENFRSGGTAKRRQEHKQLVERFLVDLERRANAGEIDTSTVVRCRSALSHYQEFVQQSSVELKWPHAARVDRDFALTFAAFLSTRRISPNGHANTVKRRMMSTAYVEDVIRGMFLWAADPDRGNLLPEGFRNPFLKRQHARRPPTRDLFGEPDITMEMACEFLARCDRFQLPLFSLLVCHGLRAAEPCWVFREKLSDDCLHVACLLELEYLTKGRRDKRLPLVAPLGNLLHQQPVECGPLFVRRAVFEGREQPKLRNVGLKDLVKEFERRCRKATPDVSAQLRIRDGLLQDAGGLNYDHVQHEFMRLAKTLEWPETATLKDFRHLYSTVLENAGMPEYYRKYLMGQEPGKAAVVNYTHVNKVQEWYERAVRGEFAPVLETIASRAREL